jgi:UDP-2,3-diacylglucosamine pyrophosphatase LpxH
MNKAAIFVSDLHLGRGDELEDFVPENERAFVNFLQHQSDAFFGRDLDLVLLGDFLDIWQVATEAEKHAPTSTAIDLSVSAASETRRAQEIVSAHPDTFAALRKFLEADSTKRRVVCIPGNHDHSLVHRDVRGVVYRAIVAGRPSIEGGVVFPLCYDAPELLTYAEHGSQFDDNNHYEDFLTFGDESPGFFFVRLFWNRLELLEPNADIWMESFTAIWKNRLWRLIEPAYRYYRQYVADPRDFARIDVPGVPFFAAAGPRIGVPVTGKPLRDFPDLLFSDRGDPERIFSTSDLTENRLRKLYHDPNSKGFKDEVDKILDEKYQGQPPVVPAGNVPTTADFGLLSDPYATAVEGMFAPVGQRSVTQPLKGSALNRDTYWYVLLGHTHHEKEETFGDSGEKYFNTGSWSVRRSAEGDNESRLCFVIVQKGHDGIVRAEQDFWPLR